jgi:hypothetical protein
MDGRPPRFNFFSLTFLVGFGLGSFMGVMLGLVALAMVRGEAEVIPAAAAVTEPSPTVVALSTATLAEPKAKTRAALDVRLGPGDAFAVVGTIARGSEIEAVGRDQTGNWVAVRFPPGSSARGWLPVSEIENLSEVESLAVVAPTPLPRTTTPPTPVPFTGGSGTPSRAATPTATPRTAPAAPVSPTPAGNTGPSDLVVTRASLLPDGRVQVVVGNRGPGDLSGKSIFVLVRDLTLRSEQLVSNQPIPVGSVVTLNTQTFRLERDADIQVIVDPFQSIGDPDQTNNRLTVTLSPAPAPPAGRGPRD